MRGLVRAWDGKVEGLGAAGLEALVWGAPLGGQVKGALLTAGFELIERYDGKAATLVVAGGSVVGPQALQAAWQQGATAGQDLAFQLGGRTGELLARLAFDQSPVCIWYLHQGGSDALDERIQAAELCTLDPQERMLPVPMPGELEGIPVSDRLALPVRHWQQLLWANLLGLGPYLWGALLGRSLPGMAGRLLWAILRSLSFRPERIASRLSRLGKGARVHPRAVVEASVLGPGASVGAGAVVRGCVLGAGARVEALALCEGSVLGAGAVVQRQAMVKYCLLAEEAMVGGAIQLGIMGPGSKLKRGSYGMDQGLDGPVRVRVGDALLPAPLGLAGVCLGASTLVGSGVWIAPGRVLPAGVVVLGADPLRDPSTPQSGAGPLRVISGGLEPCS